MALPGLLIVLVLKTLFFLLIEVPAVGLVIRTRMGRREEPAVAGLPTPQDPGPPPPVGASPELP